MKTVATHSGAFHADEICAVATLKLVHGDDVEVIRTRNPKEYSPADFVIDVGGVYDPSMGRFDHHQVNGAGVRANGIPYASFGLLWKEYGIGLCSGETAVAEKIERKLVMPIDALDNGISIATNIHKDIYPYLIHDVFSSFFPNEDATKENIDRAFLSCVSFAKDLLFREISHAKNYVTQEQIVEDIYQKSVEKGIIVFDKRYPWKAVMSRHQEPLFVVYPDIEGERWTVKGVNVDPVSFELRKPLPEAWAGKSAEELQKISGVSDAVFCHNGRFIAVAESKEGAMALAHIALNS